MKVQEGMLRAWAKNISWGQAAEILGIRDRHGRRIRERYEQFGYFGLLDRRRGQPSPKRVPGAPVEQVLGWYGEKYFDGTVRHFHEKLREPHEMDRSYTWVKSARQGAGWGARQRPRGVHRQRRPRRPLPGRLLPIDGSQHPWFPDERGQDLMVILEDAPREIYSAQLSEEESTVTGRAGLKEGMESKGVFCAFYRDRGSHCWLTPKAGGKIDPHRVTPVGRALRELGVQRIPAYSPPARGRSERNLGSWQGRLPQELRLRGLHRWEAANRFLREPYIAEFNRRYQGPAAQRGSALVRRSSKDLDLIFALPFERTVHRDHTVRVQNLRLQIEPVRWRATLAGCTLTVHQHWDGTFTITPGPPRLGHYRADGVSLENHKIGGREAVEQTQGGTVKKPTFPPCWEIPPTPRDSHFPTASAAAGD